MLFCLVGCDNANPDKPQERTSISEDSLQVLQAAEQLSLGFKNKDLELLKGVYGDSITRMSVGSPASVISKDSLLQRIEIFFNKVDFDQLERKTVELKISDGLAVIRSMYREHWYVDGDTILMVGKDVDIWEKDQKGEWRLTLLSGDEYEEEK